MFTMNCNVITTEQLKFPHQNKSGKKKRKTGATDSDNDPDSHDLYNPVKCAECNTDVAVMDKDEVFHFFNVLSGYG